MIGNNVNNSKPVENPQGVTRRTLAHNNETMLCHFELRRGAVIPLHQHAPTQIGYVVSGKVRFFEGNMNESFVVTAGDSYVFDPNMPHGAEALEDTVYIEVFSPSRPEYADTEHK